MNPDKSWLIIYDPIMTLMTKNFKKNYNRVVTESNYDSWFINHEGSLSLVINHKGLKG
jgi:hypothetical protein